MAYNMNSFPLNVAIEKTESLPAFITASKIARFWQMNGLLLTLRARGSVEDHVLSA